MASITINIGGGTPNYTVEVLGSIDGPWIFTENGEQTITGSFLPGWYTIRVTDSNGCVAEDTQEICGTTTTSTTGLVSWEAEFTNHVCEQYECDIQYEILEVTFATTTTTTTTIDCPEGMCGYGLLYNQYAVQDVRNIANTGWHVATYDEVGDLIEWAGGYKDVVEVGAETYYADVFVEPNPDYWDGLNPIPTNTTCFSARGNSYRYEDGVFYNIGWWSSMWLAEDNAWSDIESWWDEETEQYYWWWGAGSYRLMYKVSGLGVRLVMDDPSSWYSGMLYVGNDGQTYQTVLINGDVWIVENLKETMYRNGDIIPEVTDSSEWAGLTSGALCAYDNDWETNVCMSRPPIYTTTTTTTTLEPTTTTSTTSTSSTTTTTTLEPSTTTTTTTIEPYDYCVEYGYLYNWYAATDARNIAPAGWHVPTRTEFETLYANAPGSSAIDKVNALCDSEYWAGGGGNNLTGFNARGSGQRGDNVDRGRFVSIGTLYSILSATENGANYCYCAILSARTAFLPNAWYYKSNGYSLRLIKDDSNDTGTMTGNDGKVYPTVKIGDQVWMAANSAETQYRNGNTIPTVTDNTTWVGLTTGAKCAYDNIESYVGYEGVCPTTTTTTEEPTTTTTTTEELTTTTTVEPTTTTTTTTTTSTTSTSSTTTTGEPTTTSTTTEEVTTTTTTTSTSTSTTTTTTTVAPTTTTTTSSSTTTTTTTAEPTTTSTTTTAPTTTTTTTLAEEDMSYCWWLHIPEADLTSGTDVLWAYRQIESQSNSWVRVIATSPVGGYAEACVCSVSAPLYGYAPIAGPAPSEPQDIVAIEETKTATHCTDDGNCSQCWETTTTTTIIT